jgi:hypothetical protein
MKLIDTVNRSEWSRNFAGEQPHDGVIAVADDHPFFVGFNKQTHYLSWVIGEEPVLVEYTQEELNAIEELNYQSNKPNYSGKEFIEKFTIDELRAIWNYANTIVDVRIWIDRLVGASYVDPTDPALQQGMAYMVYQGLITQQRYTEIMTW